MRQTIAVIGAGLSGLVATKELAEAGLDVTCFEKTHEIGGVFSSGEASKCYDSVVLTTSNYFTAYSDFMPYGEPLKFWRFPEYAAYLKRYAEHFGVDRHIRFGHGLQAMRRLPNGQWSLRLHTDDDESRELTFDRVVICSGQFQQPNLPDIPGLALFPGPVIHSVGYKNTDHLQGFHDKRVLCLGCGESAANVVHEIARIAKHSVLSLRRHHVHSLRFPSFGKYPIDVAQSRFWHSLPAANKAAILRQRWTDMLNDSDDEAIRLFAMNNLAASDEPGSVVTKTELIFEAQARHGLQIDIGGIRKIDGSHVTFESGRQETFDAIALCTGFRFSLPFLPFEYQFKDIRKCYLQMFHPELRDSLAFIGFARPQQGGVPLIAELQARYYALICAGVRQLPENLAALAARDANGWKTEFYATPNVHGLVNGLRFNERLTDLIGCRPPIPNPLLSPGKYLRYWFHHVWPCQYRLVGPGARPEASRRWIEAPSVMTKTAQFRALGSMLALRSRSAFLKSNELLLRWRPLSEDKSSAREA